MAQDQEVRGFVIPDFFQVQVLTIRGHRSILGPGAEISVEKAKGINFGLTGASGGFVPWAQLEAVIISRT